MLKNILSIIESTIKKYQDEKTLQRLNVKNLLYFSLFLIFLRRINFILDLKFSFFIISILAFFLTIILNNFFLIIEEKLRNIVFVEIIVYYAIKIFDLILSIFDFF